MTHRVPSIVAELGSPSSLARKKAQGALLGNRTNLAKAASKDTAANRKADDAFAANMLLRVPASDAGEWRHGAP